MRMLARIITLPLIVALWAILCLLCIFAVGEAVWRFVSRWR